MSAVKKQSLTSVLQSMEVGETLEVKYGYMTTMVTISRMKKEKFSLTEKKYMVDKLEDKLTSVKRLK